MKLVVGLGNPGREYEGTRHNVGFEVLRNLAARHHGGRGRSKFKGELVEIEIDGQKVGLLMPLTYMNLSGQAVKAAVDFFKVPLSDLLLICDDLSLELGRLRVRGSGSAGGQRGLANTIQMLGSEAFPRLRVGIGQAPGERSAADFVLGVFSKAERSIMDVAVMRAADAVETWVRSGIEAAMNRFNPDPRAEAKPKTETKQKKPSRESAGSPEPSEKEPSDPDAKP